MKLPDLKTAAWLTACLLFAGAYYQYPLFSSNQNTYFLIGLARAGYGYLSADWLANQTDHAPVFSSIVSLIEIHGGRWLFRVLFGVLAAGYAASLAAIALGPAGNARRINQTAIFLAGLTLLYCPWVLNPLAGVDPGWRPFVQRFQHLAGLATTGVAEQGILRPFFQPSTFGVLLVASIACFVYGKEFAAILFAALAAALHPGYILHAGVLAASYMIILAGERRPGRAAGLGILAGLLILPLILYVFLALGPGSPQLNARARSILVEERISHHALVSVWLGRGALIQFALILTGIGASYRSRRLFRVLVLGLCAGFLLTLLQVISGSTWLALLFPWRISTWLVAICSAVLLARLSAGAVWIIDRLPPQWLRPSCNTAVIGLSFLFLAGSGFFGVRKTLAPPPSDPVAAGAQANSSPGQTYLIPLEYQSFRLTSGLPVFIDWKSHPFRAAEVVEWYRRVQLARAFYRAGSGEEAAGALAAIAGEAEITHVIVEREQGHLLAGLPAREILRDCRYVLAELNGGRRGEEAEQGRR